MTAPDVDDALAERIGALVDAHPKLSDARAHAWAQTLAVPCPYCPAVAGEQCVRSDGKPLETWIGHPRRVLDAGVDVRTDEAFRTGGARRCRDADPAQGCPRCHSKRSAASDAWRESSAPETGSAHDQDWRH